jgi:GntR family transcriptional regulator
MGLLQTGTIPLYQQLADRLRRQIAEGAYRIGDRLPSEDALGEEFGVSRITVRAALDQLSSAGLLRRQRGKGTFVSAPPVEHELIRLTDFVEDMIAAGLRPASRVLQLGEEPTSVEVAAQLRIAPGTPVVRLDRLRLGDNDPIAVDTTFLPLRYGRLLEPEHLEDETIYRQLETRYGIPVVSGTFMIEAGVAPPDLAAQLQVDQGSPLLIIRRTSYGASQEVIYYQWRYYRADRVQYRLDLSRDFPNRPSRLTEFAPVFEPGEID